MADSWGSRREGARAVYALIVKRLRPKIHNSVGREEEKLQQFRKIDVEP
jgi:hypothetical protein